MSHHVSRYALLLAVSSSLCCIPQTRGQTMNQVLPFDPPPPATLRASPRKVFAHYFVPFPISTDNEWPDEDYYTTEYLSPDGEDGKFRHGGGYLRERPLPRAPRPEVNWAALDLREEVRRAAAIGLDGFTCDILTTSGPLWASVRGLLDAARAVDPGFRIVLMPDMAAEFLAHPERLAGAIRSLAGHPAVHRLSDGRLVVAPFNAQERSAGWWKQWLDTMKKTGVNVALWPVFQSWETHAPAFAPFSIGMSSWGSRSPSGGGQLLEDPVTAHGYNRLWMAPVAPQDVRPKDLRYWESHNTVAYRTMWEAAINGGADWVHVITWNDYSESTEIAPSTSIQYLFYDLTAYYVTWFKTGRQPTIRRDVLYYSHRIQPTDAQWNRARQSGAFQLASAYAPRDEVELLAFLRAPATLQTELGGQTWRWQASAGVTPVRVLLAPGQPVFRLIRNGRIEIALRSKGQIADTVPVQDLLYHGGSSSRPPVP